MAYRTLPAIYTTVVDREKRCITSIKKPYVSDEAQLNSPIVVHSSGICLLDGAEDIYPRTWKCHSMCKTLSEAEKLQILQLKKDFENPVEQVRSLLESIDTDCPHGHYFKHTELNIAEDEIEQSEIDDKMSFTDEFYHENMPAYDDMSISDEETSHHSDTDDGINSVVSDLEEHQQLDYESEGPKKDCIVDDSDLSTSNIQGCHTTGELTDANDIEACDTASVLTDTDDFESCDTTSELTDYDMLEQDVMEVTSLNSADGLVKLQGHPLPCHLGCCESKLRLLRAASVHYPPLRSLLNNIYCVRRCDKLIKKIDNDLASGCIQSLLSNISIENCADLLEDDSLPSSPTDTDGLPGEVSESHLEVEFAEVIQEFYEKLKQDPEFKCCSCERLLMKKALTHFNFTTEKFCSDTWTQLKNYMTEKDPDASKKVHYVCAHCRPILNANNMPGRCVLNGLFSEPIPIELCNLNTIEKQFIQRAKCFQTIVRLGTYTRKVPLYNALKAVKGTMFFLPLGMEDTMRKLEGSGISADCFSDPSYELPDCLPDPELHILVDSRPTKDKVVWQSLADIRKVKEAVQKLQQTNWLYGKVTEASVDDAAEKVIEVVNEATSALIEKSSDEDIAALDAYTIRRMDQFSSTGKDIDHYKLLHVKEKPLDNRLKYLDVLCFPTLFPSGHYGEFHPRTVNLAFSEYIKSRVMNADSRFRKNPEFLFYYLFQKEMRQLAQGIYNVLNSTGKRHLTVKQFMEGVNSSDSNTEANLYTVLQSVRGTKQFWYQKKVM